MGSSGAADRAAASSTSSSTSSGGGDHEFSHAALRQHAMRRCSADGRGAGRHRGCWPPGDTQPGPEWSRWSRWSRLPDHPGQGRPTRAHRHWSQPAPRGAAWRRPTRALLTPGSQPSGKGQPGPQAAACGAVWHRPTRALLAPGRLVPSLPGGGSLSTGYPTWARLV